MLDTQDIIIPIDPQCGNDVRPNLQAVPAANRAESPSSCFDIAVWLHVCQPMHVDIILIKIRIFGMKMMNRICFT